jgi:hypothetical protein
MIENMSEFEAIQSRLQEIISALDGINDERVENARIQLHTLDGAIERYVDVNYPIPFKRPDAPVLEIANAAAGLAESLKQLLPTSLEPGSTNNA